MTEIVAAFHRRYAGLNVSVRLGNSEDTVCDLLAYQTEVAVLAQYEAYHKLYYVLNRRHPLVIIVPASHRPPCDTQRQIADNRLIR